MSKESTPERLQKIIAQAGLASRREAEEWIRDGLVTVNGQVAKLGDKAVFGKDAIKVKGKLLITTAAKVYYLFYKPRNVIAMINEDEEGRPTIKDLITRIPERVFTVGRMDFTGEGAIILTNDGEMAQEILKSNTIIRRYHVKLNREPSADELQKIGRGGRIEGVSVNPLHVRLVSVYQKNALLELSFEGMHPIDLKKFFENKGFFAEKIIRVGIGHLNAEHLQPGTFKRVEQSSMKALFKQPELAMKQIEALTQKRVKVVTKEERTTRPRKPRVSDEGSAFERSKKPGGARPARRDALPAKIGFKSDRGPREDRGGDRPARPMRSDSRGPRAEGRSFDRPARGGKPAGRGGPARSSAPRGKRARG